MLSWLQGDQDVYALIARKNYPKAVKLLRQQLRKDPKSVHLRQLLADVLSQAGESGQAIDILEPLVDEFVAEGFVAKAIAMLKKIQRINPARSDIDSKLAALIEGKDTGTAESQLPLIRAHLEDTRDDLTLPSEEVTTELAEPPLVTSEIRADWFDEAVEERQDFHWSPLLAGFTREELAALIGGLKLLVKNPGAIIYGEDEPGSSLFILASGKARVYRRDGTGHYAQVDLRQEGDFFGEASVLTLSNRRFTVTAITECELLELDRATFDRLSKKFPKVHETIQQLHNSRPWTSPASMSEELIGDIKIQARCRFCPALEILLARTGSHTRRSPTDFVAESATRFEIIELCRVLVYAIQ